MQICEAKLCTGCSACANICPKQCITIEKDRDGFLRPQIDEEKCIQCMSCVSHCPQNNSIRLNRYSNPTVFAAYSSNSKQMKVSTSGGIFPILAEHIIEQGGCVYGAQMQNDFSVNFTRIKEKSEIIKLQGSKYVQSNIDMIYKSVLKDLQKKIPVLFSGLPCQIGGLYSFLGKDYANLFTIDVVCRGVLSEKILKEYISYREKKENSKLSDLVFRYKASNWKPMSYGTVMHLAFNNGRHYNRNLTSEPYYATFLKNIAMKESCYLCRYNGFPRIGDITLGDFAGLGVLETTNFYNKQGISQVLINSCKGKAIYESCTKRIIDERRTLDECCFFNLNLWKSTDRNSGRELFLDEIEQKGIEIALKKYISDSKSRLLQKVKDIIIYVLGEKRVLWGMHKKRISDNIYPTQWPKNKYVTYNGINDDEKEIV